jgi:uncharacterized protein
VSLRIEETFQLQAPTDRVWAYLTDPRQVVTCLPGAELTSVQDESTFLGKVKVKVGPVTAAYSGKVVITERDEATRVVRIVGEGRESAGTGSAKMTMTSTLVALPSGGTEVRVTADVDIVGKIVQFGRGMIESVNKQLFKQFTACVRATLEAPGAPANESAAAVGEEPAASSGTPAPSGSTSESRPAGVASTPTAVTDPAAPIGHAAPAPSASAPRTSGAGRRDATTAAGPPVRLLPLVGRALWENVVGLLRALGRLVGRRGRRGV